MYKIKRLYSGEDYTLYEYETLNGDIFEVEITGTAQDIIDSLLELLDTYKKYHER